MDVPAKRQTTVFWLSDRSMMHTYGNPVLCLLKRPLTLPFFHSFLCNDGLGESGVLLRLLRNDADRFAIARRVD